MRCSIPVKNRRRVLCVFPHYALRSATFNHAYRLMKGVRAFMPPQGLLLIAAYMPEGWPVRFIDENIAHGDRRRLRVGRRRRWSAACTSRRRRFTTSHARAHAAGKVVGAGRAVGVGLARNVSGHRLSPRRRDRRCHRSARSRASTRASRRRPRRCASRPRSGCRCSDFPIPAYDLIPLDELSDAARLQFSSGCPYLLRVLRHPQPLRPPAAAQDAAADHRRARCHAPAEGASAGGLFRRRQFHRQSQGRQGHAAASRRLAEAARLSDAVRLRGDAQHRQADRKSSS